MDGDRTARATAWPDGILSERRRWQVRQVAHAPDGGHARLIRAVLADPARRAIPLTTEEEGVAVLAGAALGGHRGVLPMQSSGAGNCVNILSLAKACRFPFLALVMMRGEWGEFNPWQVPMASATEAAFRLMDVEVRRAGPGTARRGGGDRPRRGAPRAAEPRRGPCPRADDGRARPCRLTALPAARPGPNPRSNGS